MKNLIRALLMMLLLAACGPGAEGPQGPAGKDGAQGATGAAGPTGAQGTAGAAGSTMTTSYLCMTDVATAGLLLMHKVYDYTDGSVLATCEVFMPQGTFTGLNLLKASQAGAATATCIVGADIDASVNGGYWVLYFNRATKASSATYKDPSSSANNMTVNLACTAAP